MRSIDKADTPSRAMISAVQSRMSDCRSRGASRTRFRGVAFDLVLGSRIARIPGQGVPRADPWKPIEYIVVC
jgi:hypothetical protein